jgi:hypothetical protein
VLAQLTAVQMNTSLPPAAQAQINVIISQLLRLDSRLTSDGLKKAVEESGVFFESNVIKKKKALVGDLKGQFFKLQTMLASAASNNSNAPSIAQSLSIVKQAINKITLDQYLYAQDLNGLGFSIPLIHQNQYKMLEFNVREPTDKSNRWEVVFSVEIMDDVLTCSLSYDVLEELLDCRIEMVVEQNLQAVQADLPILKQMFKDAKIVVRHFILAKGNSKVMNGNFSTNGLVDIKV